MNLLRNQVYVFLFSAYVCFLSVTILAAPDKSTDTNSKPTTGVVKDGKAKGPPNCRKFMLVMAKKQMKIIKLCFDEVKAIYPSNEDMNKHFQCVIKCALKKEEILDQNSKITNETVSKYFDKNIPLEYHKLGYEIMGKCSAIWNPKFDPAEPTCFSYGEYVKCLQEYVSDIC